MPISTLNKQRIEAYRGWCGKNGVPGHFIFACHASIPLLFSVDLLYNLWNNFQKRIDDKNASYLAVSDLILSPLAEPVGYETYRMNAEIRGMLQKELENLAGKERTKQVAMFLKQYASRHYNNSEKNIRDIHLFAADNILHPENVREQLKERVTDNSKSELERVKYLTLYFDLNNLTEGGEKENYLTLVYEPDATKEGVIKLPLPLTLRNKIKGIPESKPTSAEQEKANSSSALELINKCLSASETVLDLGNCGLSDEDLAPGGAILTALNKCGHLETLILSNKRWDSDSRSYVYGNNKGVENRLTVMPVLELPDLKGLTFCGDGDFKLSNADIIAGLTQLEYLVLSNNNIADCSFLAQLNRLTFLDLGNNRQITDISWLNSTYLRVLYLNGCYISNLSFLRTNNEIETLYLQNNEVMDIEPLKYLNRLAIVNLGCNDVERIPISIVNMDIPIYVEEDALEKGRGIYLFDNPLYEPPVDIIKSGRKAIYDYLYYFKERNLGLSFQEALRIVRECIRNRGKILDFGNCGLRDDDFETNRVLIDSIKNCRHVHTLILSNSRWNGIDGYGDGGNNLGEKNKLTKVPVILQDQIETLVFNGDSGCRLTDADSIAAYSCLRILDISNNAIENCYFLRDLVNLTTIFLNNNRIADIRPLAKLKKLQRLFLSENSIEDLSPLGALASLKELHLQRNYIRDLTPLKNLVSLELLWCKQNAIEDLRPLKGLVRLKRLGLFGNRIENIYPLAGLRQLEILNVGGNNIKEIPSEFATFDIPILNEERDSGENKKGIFVFDNPIVSPPWEILNHGPQAVRDYLNSGDNGRDIRRSTEKIFISYSARDKEWATQIFEIFIAIDPVFARNNIWYDGLIGSGDKWNDAISDAMNMATAVIMLVSSDYLASDYIREKEMKYFLKKPNVKIFWFLVNECAWERTSLREIQGLNPRNSLASYRGGRANMLVSEKCGHIYDVLFQTADPKTRILIVDDDEDDFIITAEYLNSIPGANYVLKWCSDYRDAEEFILAKEHDVYLVDYRLGRKTGIDLLKFAMANNCTQPIILFSGKGNYEVDIEAMRFGAANYMDKTDLSIERLERSIRYSLHRSALLRRLIAIKGESSTQSYLDPPPYSFSERKMVSILIIDEEKDDYTITAGYLSNNNNRSFSCKVEWSRYAGAYTYMAQQKYDLYILGDGPHSSSAIDLLREASNSNIEEPIILLTGNGNYESDVRAMELGAADYLIKMDLSMEKLERSIRYALEHSKQLKALRNSSSY